MVNEFKSDCSEVDSFDLINIMEFDRRVRAAKPWLAVVGIFYIITLPLVIIGCSYVSNKLEWLPGLMIAVIFIILLLSIIPFIFLSNYIVRRFELNCPCCKKSLNIYYRSFRTYIRHKGKLYLESNPFISGQCRECKKIVIETDAELNSCLQERNSQMKSKNSNPTISVICCLIGVIAFTMLLNVDVDSEEQDEDMDIRSAMIQIGSGEFMEAKKALSFILHKQPNYSTARELLGYIYLQEDKLEEALVQYQKALPYSVNTARINNAVIFIKQKQKVNE